jgi:hypothetical protein
MTFFRLCAGYRRGVTRRGQRSATTLTLVGAALAYGQGGVAEAAPPPFAECHDMTMTFANVSYRSYDVVVHAVVTRPGIFQLGDGHAYFGTSETPPDPAGVAMTSTATIITPEVGESRWTASCVGGSASGVVRVPAPPRPPAVTVHGPTTVRATGHSGARDPLTATAVDSRGRRLPAHCTPAVLPATPSRTRVTCTSDRDAAGRVGTATRVVTVLGAAAQLRQLEESLGAGPLRDLVGSARSAVEHRDGPAAARRLGLVLDALPHSGLRGRRLADVRDDVLRIGHVIGRPLPLVHAVRPGETVWSVVSDALQHKTGAAPDDHAVALGVRLVLARNPGALDRYGVLHPGTVLTLPL